MFHSLCHDTNFIPELLLQINDDILNYSKMFFYAKERLTTSFWQEVVKQPFDSLRWLFHPVWSNVPDYPRDFHCEIKLFGETVHKSFHFQD